MISLERCYYPSENAKILVAHFKNRLINGVDRERLETLTEAGSASMHRGWVPEPADLSTMVDILEHFVHRAFVAPALEQKLTEKSASLRKTVPARKPRTKSKVKKAKTSSAKTIDV